MEIDKKKLKSKGWTDAEIKHAMSTVKKAQKKKNPKIKLLDENLYWIFLLVACLGNLAFSISLIPIMAVMPSWYLYFMVGLTGLLFGALFTTLINDVDSLDTRHHIIYSVMIPIIGLINFFAIVKQANVAAILLGFNAHSEFLIGFFYLVAFFVPYILLIYGVKLWNLKTG